MKTEKTRKLFYPLLAVGIALTEYIWLVWYYGRLHADGSLLSVAELQMDQIPEVFGQHIMVNLPAILLYFLSYVILKKDAAGRLGFLVSEKQGKYAVVALSLASVLLCAYGVLSERVSALRGLYGFLYYFVFVAFLEELTFRAVLPQLIKKVVFLHGANGVYRRCYLPLCTQLSH